MGAGLLGSLVQATMQGRRKVEQVAGSLGLGMGKLHAGRGIPSRLVPNHWKASCPVPHRHWDCPEGLVPPLPNFCLPSGC